MNISAGTLARTIILVLALINQILVISGHSVLPIQDDQVELLVSTVWTVVASLISWWKNNSFTAPAIKADEVLKQEKAFK